MRGIRRLGAIVAASLLLPIPGRGAPDVIGVVMEANEARLGAYSVSQGSSVFDGDRLSTGTGGALRLRGGNAMIYLREQSSAVVRKGMNSGEKGLEAELLSGEVIISSAAGAGAQITVNGARIRPEPTAAAIVQVRFMSPTELIICSRRGTSEFSYRGEDAALEEGKSYRVLLDPADDKTPADEKNKKPARRKRMFILIAIGAAAGGAAAAAAIMSGSGPASGSGFVSPDHP